MDIDQIAEQNDEIERLSETIRELRMMVAGQQLIVDAAVLWFRAVTSPEQSAATSDLRQVVSVHLGDGKRQAAA